MEDMLDVLTPRERRIIQLAFAPFDEHPRRCRRCPALARRAAGLAPTSTRCASRSSSPGTSGTRASATLRRPGWLGLDEADAAGALREVEEAGLVIGEGESANRHCTIASDHVRIGLAECWPMSLPASDCESLHLTVGSTGTRQRPILYVHSEAVPRTPS